MALTNCKECNQEISTEALACPHCGIEHPGRIDNHYRLAGFVALGLIILFGITIYTKSQHGATRGTTTTDSDPSQTNRLAEITPASNPTQNLPNQNQPSPTSEDNAAAPEQTKPVIIPTASVKEAEPIHDKLNDSINNTPEMLVRKMLNDAGKDGSLTAESDIQSIKQQIERLPKPAKGNKKAAKALNAKGLSASRKGDFFSAEKMFKQAHHLDRSDVEIVNNLGYAQIKQGHLDLAEQTITLALTLSPGRSTAWENYGEILGIQGNIDQATAAFGIAYQFSKNPAAMHQAMKKLYDAEQINSLKQARANAIARAEKTYPNLKTLK